MILPRAPFVRVLREVLRTFGNFRMSHDVVDLLCARCQVAVDVAKEVLAALSKTIAKNETAFDMYFNDAEKTARYLVRTLLHGWFQGVSFESLIDPRNLIPVSHLMPAVADINLDGRLVTVVSYAPSCNNCPDSQSCFLISGKNGACYHCSQRKIASKSTRSHDHGVYMTVVRTRQEPGVRSLKEIRWYQTPQRISGVSSGVRAVLLCLAIWN